MRYQRRCPKPIGPTGLTLHHCHSDETTDACTPARTTNVSNPTTTLGHKGNPCLGNVKKYSKYDNHSLRLKGEFWHKKKNNRSVTHLIILWVYDILDFKGEITGHFDGALTHYQDK